MTQEEMDMETQIRETVDHLLTHVGMSKSELARRLDMDRVTVLRKLSGTKGIIRANDLPRFAGVFGITVSELIQGYAWMSQNRCLPPGKRDAGQTRI